MSITGNRKQENETVQMEEVLYAIPGNNEKGGRIFIMGNKNAKHILFFSAGFPDYCNAFIPFAKRFAQNNDCLCGVTCLPGYDTHHNNYKKEGYTFDDIVISLREAVKTLKSMSTNNSDNVKLTGIFHDWGSIVGSILTNRMNIEKDGYFAETVYFDVLPPAHTSLNIDKENNFKKKIMTIGYTTILGISNAIQRFISHYIAAIYFIFGFLSMTLLGLKSSGDLDQKVFDTREPKLTLRKMIYMAYPYYYMYKGKLLGQKSGKEQSDCYFPINLQKTPVMYLYGINKPLQYHDENYVKYLDKQSKTGKCGKTKVVPVHNAAHWLYIQQPDICYDEVKKFIFS